MKSKTIIIVVILALVGGSLWLTRNNPSHHTDVAKDRGLVTVRFANLPYADHTITSIGIEKGFFKEVGIDLRA
jgi:hypothetical protein